MRPAAWRAGKPTGAGGSPRDDDVTPLERRHDPWQQPDVRRDNGTPRPGHPGPGRCRTPRLQTPRRRVTVSTLHDRDRLPTSRRRDSHRPRLGSLRIGHHGPTPMLRRLRRPMSRRHRTLIIAVAVVGALLLVAGVWLPLVAWHEMPRTAARPPPHRPARVPGSWRLSTISTWTRRGHSPSGFVAVRRVRGVVRASVLQLARADAQQGCRGDDAAGSRLRQRRRHAVRRASRHAVRVGRERREGPDLRQRVHQGEHPVRSTRTTAARCRSKPPTAGRPSMSTSRYQPRRHKATSTVERASDPTRAAVRRSGPDRRRVRAHLQILGRRPTTTELALYSVMWSEHCSYKSSKLHLRQFAEKAPKTECTPRRHGRERRGRRRRPGLRGHLQNRVAQPPVVR